MLGLSENDVKRAIDMDAVLEAVMQAYRDYSDQRIDLFPRVTMAIRGEDHAAILLPATDRPNFFYGFKQASIFPSNMEKGMNTVFADIHLYSAETGEPVAM